MFMYLNYPFSSLFSFTFILFTFSDFMFFFLCLFLPPFKQFLSYLVEISANYTCLLLPERDFIFLFSHFLPGYYIYFAVLCRNSCVTPLLSSILASFSFWVFEMGSNLHLHFSFSFDLSIILPVNVFISSPFTSLTVFPFVRVEISNYAFAFLSQIPFHLFSFSHLSVKLGVFFSFLLTFFFKFAFRVQMKHLGISTCLFILYSLSHLEIELLVCAVFYFHVFSLSVLSLYLVCRWNTCLPLELAFISLSHLDIKLPVQAVSRYFYFVSSIRVSLAVLLSTVYFSFSCSSSTHSLHFTCYFRFILLRLSVYVLIIFLPILFFLYFIFVFHFSQSANPLSRPFLILAIYFIFSSASDVIFMVFLLIFFPFLPLCP